MICVFVVEVDFGRVELVEGRRETFRRGPMGENPLGVPVQRPHARKPEGPLEDHEETQTGVTSHFVTILTSDSSKRK